MGQLLRFLWFLSLGLVFAVTARITWLYFDQHFMPLRVWIETPTAEDLIRLGLYGVGGVGLAISSRPLGKRLAYVAFGLAIALTLASYFLGNEFSVTASERASTKTYIPSRKPIASKTVLGYHWQTPQLGGQVAFGDGSVSYLTKEEFLSSPKAAPPDYEPRFQAPRKSDPAEPGAAEPKKAEPSTNPRDPLAVVRQAEERMKVASFLKRLAVAHFSLVQRVDGRPPLEPSELRKDAGLTDQELAALTDGTYVWAYGWSPFEIPKYSWADVERMSKLSWLALHAFGASVGLLLFAIIKLVGTRRPSRPVRETTAPTGSEVSPGSARNGGV